MTRKLSDSHLSIIKKERVYYDHMSTFLRNFQCKWMLWSVDSRTIIHAYDELLADIVRTALLLLLTFSPAVTFFLILTILFL